MDRFSLPRIVPDEDTQELKRRQGRSYKARKRIKENESLYRGVVFVCPDCLSRPELIYDSTSGDVICNNCGLVLEDFGHFDSFAPFGAGGRCIYLSKGYRTVDYARERLAQLNNCDPWIWNDEFNKIKEAARKLTFGQLERAGKLTFGKICKSVGLGFRKYGERWIQIRLRLREDWGEETVPMKMYRQMDPVLIRSLAEMTELASRCYEDHFKNKTLKIQETNGFKMFNRKLKFGKNILSTSYLFIQILRILGKFHSSWKSFIYISRNNHKLSIYNAKWKKMIEVLQCYYTVYTQRNKEGDIIQERNYSWKYMPLLKVHLMTDIKFV